MATQFVAEMLAERGVFALTPEKWSEFQSALDASVRAMPRLEALLKETRFFERGSEGERTLQLRNMRNYPILEALFPEVRARVLAATFGQPEREWYVTELARALDTRPSSLQRELEALSKAGILEQRRDGRRLYVRPDKTSPVFADLKHLLEKTAGLIPILSRELEPLGESVRVAFLYGSIARSEETSVSDIDLMVIGTAGLSDLIPALRSSEQALGRPVNPTVYSLQEFQQKVVRKDHFLTAVLRGAKQFVKGSEHDLEAISGQG